MKSKIIEDKNKLNDLLDKNISINFHNLELKYELKKINSIYGTRNKMDKDGSKVVSYSKFNTNDAAILVSYIVFEQLNLFYENNYDSSNKIILYQKSSKNKYIAQFVNIIIQEIEEDYELFNICNKNNEFEHLDARFYNAYQLKIITSDEKVEIKDFMQLISDSRGVSSEDTYTTIEDEIKASDEKKDLIESINDKDKFEKIKKEFVENNEEELDLITLKQIKDRIEEENEDIKDDEFINDGELKNKDILDTGSEYGSLAEFDFETGEGFAESEYE